MNFDAYIEFRCDDDPYVMLEMATEGTASQHTFCLTVQEARELQEAIAKALLSYDAMGIEEKP